MALLCYRATPLPWCNLSPSEFLMGRRLRTNLPVRKEELQPKLLDMEIFQQQDKAFKEKQKKDHDHHHRALTLPLIPDNTHVWVTTDKKNTPARVISQADTPRSYLVETPSGQMCRNRRQLNVVPTSDGTVNHDVEPASPNRIVTRSQTGLLRIPNRLQYKTLSEILFD